ncbi:MAG: response regulator [Gammaproteobacteria bacterium]|nr:response regulator [Gammaproteobacteria bacterium]
MKRLLIADDEPHIIRVMKLALEKNGYEVKTAPNGQVAFELVMANQPDVLITDIQMPKMTGEELCKKINSEICDRKFMIFVLSSRAEIEHRDWVKDMENIAFIEKPASMIRLVSRINDYFDRVGIN